MKTEYVYDQDPRYGWVHIDMEEKKYGLIVVQDESGISYGFNYKDGEMTPTCICNAWDESECGCGLY